MCVCRIYYIQFYVRQSVHFGSWITVQALLKLVMRNRSHFSNFENVYNWLIIIIWLAVCMFVQDIHGVYCTGGVGHGGIIEKERACTPLQRYNHHFRCLYNNPDNNTEPNPLPVTSVNEVLIAGLIAYGKTSKCAFRLLPSSGSRS
jgi:hypothetical protein